MVLSEKRVIIGLGTVTVRIEFVCRDLPPRKLCHL